MNEDVHQASESGFVTQHIKPKHFAKRLEGYVGVAMVVAAVLMLAFLAYAFMNTGNTPPSWMR